MLEEQPDKNRANKNTKVIFFIVTRLSFLMVVDGSRQTVGLMFGAIGILIAHSSETNDDLIMAHLKKNNINIGKIAIFHILIKAD
jgi:hypothetical protein